jgi:hypothetical protein
MAMNSRPSDEHGIGGELAGGDLATPGIDRAEEARVGDVGSPDPVDQPDTGADSTGGDPEVGADEATDRMRRTDLDEAEPGDGYGVGPWGARDVSRDEALRALGGPDAVDRPRDPTAPSGEAEGGTEEVR